MHTQTWVILSSHVEWPVANLMRSDGKGKIRIWYALDVGIVANQPPKPSVSLELSCDAILGQSRTGRLQDQ